MVRKLGGLPTWGEVPSRLSIRPNRTSIRQVAGRPANGDEAGENLLVRPTGVHMKAVRLALKTRRSAGRGKSARPAPAYDFRVLFFEREGSWSAQCLERDIAAQARTLEDLYDEVERVLAAHIVVAEELGQEPFMGIGPAPEKYWDIFKRSHLRVTRPATASKHKTPSYPKIHSAIRVAERLSA